MILAVNYTKKKIKNKLSEVILLFDLNFINLRKVLETTQNTPVIIKQHPSNIIIAPA